MVIKGYHVWPLVKRTGKEIAEDNILGLAAETAYYFFFSLFPFLLFAMPLIGLVADRQAVLRWALGQLSQVVPGGALQLVQGVAREVVFSPNAPGLISIGIVLALWSGSAVFTALIGALNVAFDVRETRPWWKTRLMALAAVLVSSVLVLLAAAVLLAGPEIVAWIGGLAGLSSAARTAWLVLQYPVAFALLVGLVWLIYTVLPNTRHNKRHALTGALIAAVLWVVVTLLFRLYVTNFGSYNKTYGTIGAVIVLLTWMYLTMLVLLAAGELTSELYHGTGAVSPRRGGAAEGRAARDANAGRSVMERVQPKDLPKELRKRRAK